MRYKKQPVQPRFSLRGPNNIQKLLNFFENCEISSVTGTGDIFQIQ